MSGRAVPVAGSARDQSPAEQVLRRAVELADRAAAAGGGELTVSQLRQVAAEVGVPGPAVAAAVAERQVSAGLPPAGAVSRLVGPVAVVGWRHVEADQHRTEALVVDWLERHHALRVRRLGDGTVVATRRPGVAGSVARTLRSARGGRELAGRGEVRASVVPDTDDGTGSVACVLVDLRHRRAAALGGGGAVSAVGLAATVVGVVFAPAIAVVGVPLSLGAGLAAAALQHRSVVRGVTEEVEVTLDALARRRAPAGAVQDLVRSASRRVQLGRAVRS